MDIALKQRGRASMDYLVGMAFFMGAGRKTVDAEAARLGLDPAALPEDFAAREAHYNRVMAPSAALKGVEAVEEWMSAHHGVIAIEAFEETGPQTAEALEAAAAAGPSTLTFKEGFVAPDYWEGVEFHRTSGGWDGHPHMGYIHGELIHRHLLNRVRPIDIFAQRRLAAGATPVADPRRIAEFGTATGHYTTALQQTYPEAEIWGCDPSVPALKHAQRAANRHGWAWNLHRAVGEDTGWPDAQFDLVTSYIIMHEAPLAINRAHLSEAFRLLRPGGWFCFADFAPLGQNDRMHELKLFRGAARAGGEPWAIDYIQTDMGEEARRAGFVDVEAKGLGPGAYPFAVMGRKPEAAA